MKSSSLLLLLLALAAPCMGSAIQIQTKVVPNGILQDSYYAVITATGGCTPYSWTVVSGALPAGIKTKTSQNSTSLLLYGKPTMAGSYPFAISAAGCHGSTSKVSYSVAVQSASNHVVNLNWVPSTTKDVVGYNIYRGLDGKLWRKINSALDASTAYSDSTVADSSTYYYATTAVDVNGVESEKSNIVQSAIP